MKFLLDMNVPRALCRALAPQGHACRHVRDAGLARASDSAIVDAAAANAEAIVTHDLDFGPLLALSGRSAPSVVILRLRDCSPEHLAVHLVRALPEIAPALVHGAIVVLEEGSVRIRDLPVEPSE
ncbi:MAG: DUF5615 family PIN-like protein [Deltaproteobacteria bacterium]|nr:DUF5615 family PIN-like protein [Deltaproteobacteria bacterium]